MLHKDSFLKNYLHIAKAISFLDKTPKNHKISPNFLADFLNISVDTLEKICKAFANITPQQLIAFSKPFSLKKILTNDLITLANPTIELIVTPLTIDKIVYANHPTPLGVVFIALMQDKICYLAFVENNELRKPLTLLQQLYPKMTLHLDTLVTQKMIEKIFFNSPNNLAKLSLFVKGTPFQIKVWQTLLGIPSGFALSYEKLAQLVNNNVQTTRATAGSVGKNPISLLIPCHRVIKKSGETHKYLWGNNCKKILLLYELGNANKL